MSDFLNDPAYSNRFLGMGPNMQPMNGPRAGMAETGLPSEQFNIGSAAQGWEADEQPIRQLLAERATTHGEYSLHAEITQAIKAVFRRYGYIGKLTPAQVETMDMTAHKYGRILAGDPEVAEHWKDTAGYNQLAADRCSK